MVFIYSKAIELSQQPINASQQPLTLGIICILAIFFSVSQLEIVDNTLNNYTYKKGLYLSLPLSHEREAYSNKRGLYSSLSAASTALPIQS